MASHQYQNATFPDVNVSEVDVRWRRRCLLEVDVCVETSTSVGDVDVYIMPHPLSLPPRVYTGVIRACNE